MIKSINWKLTLLPTVNDLIALFNAGLISEKEARFLILDITITGDTLTKK